MNTHTHSHTHTRTLTHNLVYLFVLNKFQVSSWEINYYFTMIIHLSNKHLLKTQSF